MSARALTVVEAIAKLSQMPPEAILLFRIEGIGIAKICEIAHEAGSPKPAPCCEDAVDEWNPDLFKDRAVFSASADEQVNKLAGAIKALIEAAPDRRQAIRVKGLSGLYLSPDELDTLRNWP